MDDTGPVAGASVHVRDLLVTPRRWTLWRQRPRLIVFCLVTEAVAVGSTALAAGWVHPSGKDVLVMLALAVLGIAQAELGRQVERVRRRVNGTPHINMTSVWTFAGVLLLPPVLVAALVALLYSTWRCELYRLQRAPAFRSAVNGSVVVLTCYAARLVLECSACTASRASGRRLAGRGDRPAPLWYSMVNALLAAARNLYGRKHSGRRCSAAGATTRSSWPPSASVL